MTTSETAFRNLVRAIGGGFHPDITGDNYTRLPQGVTPELVDDVIDAAIDAGVDVYAVALDVLRGRS